MAVTIAALFVMLDATNAEPLKVCTGGDRAARKVTCLVDGDTGWEAGVKWRLKGIDTPEYPPHAACDQEVELAKVATFRMRELMAGGYRITWLGETDNGGDRQLVEVVLADGRNAGIVLLEELFAVEWPHDPGVWCNR